MAVTDRLRLAVLPTPLVPAARLADALGRGELWVKRDDLTGFMTAGNKARPLEWLVGEALAEHADTLVTGGGPASNYCAGAAAAARLAGLRCILVLYGEEPAGPPHPNLALARWHGAETIFTGDPDRASVDRQVEAVAAQCRAGGGRPYTAPRGGASVTGARGYAEAGAELAGQLARGLRPATLLVAAGSGATAAGLVADAAGRGRPWRVVAAAVSRPPGETAAQVLRLARGLGRRLGWPVASEADVTVVDARGPGYGLASAAGEHATQTAAATEGLLLDPVFSAKALGVLLTGPPLPSPVVFWHTGGLVAAVAHLSAAVRQEVAT